MFFGVLLLFSFLLYCCCYFGVVLGGFGFVCFFGGFILGEGGRFCAFVGLLVFLVGIV